jgi:heme oxygenase
MAIALVFAMKLRDSNIYLNDDLEEFIANIQPAITEENYSEILRRSERTNSEITDSSQSNDDESDENDSDNDETILATLSDGTENEDDDDEEENELDSTTRGKGRQVTFFYQ